MAKDDERPKKRSRLIYILTLLFTGGGAGLGSWQLHDHPIIQNLLTKVVGDGSAAAALKSGLVDILDQKATDEPGVFEVKITGVELDEADFKDGQVVDIQARVIRYGADDKGETLWDTRSFGERLATVGRDPLTAGWGNRPFEVTWNSGDYLTVEVWDRRAKIRPVHLEMEAPESEEQFPLRSGTRRLEHLNGRKPGRIPATRIALKSKRLDDAPKGRTASGGSGSRRDPGDGSDEVIR